jgi:hypothetical protein
MVLRLGATARRNGTGGSHRITVRVTEIAKRIDAAGRGMPAAGCLTAPTRSGH